METLPIPFTMREQMLMSMPHGIGSKLVLAVGANHEFLRVGMSDEALDVAPGSRVVSGDEGMPPEEAVDLTCRYLSHHAVPIFHQA